jgi:hypothetical protein
MSVPESPCSFVEDTHKKGERIVANHGTKKVHGEKVAPFQADIVEVLKNVVVAGGACKVRRCDIPRWTSVVVHGNVYKIKQYKATPVSGENRVSVRDLSATTKKRPQKSLKAELFAVQRYTFPFSLSLAPPSCSILPTSSLCLFLSLSPSPPPHFSLPSNGHAHGRERKSGMGVTFLLSHCRKGVEWCGNRREIVGLVGIAERDYRKFFEHPLADFGLAS